MDSSRVISHLAFGVLILFIGLNYNFSLEKDFNLKLGEREEFENYSVEFKDLRFKKLVFSRKDEKNGLKLFFYRKIILNSLKYCINFNSNAKGK